MIRTLIGLVMVYAIIQVVWKFISLLTTSTKEKKKEPPKPTPKQHDSILKGGDYVNFEEIKEK